MPLRYLFVDLLAFLPLLMEISEDFIENVGKKKKGEDVANGPGKIEPCADLNLCMGPTYTLLFFMSVVSMHY